MEENSGGQIIAVEADDPNNTSGVGYDMFVPNNVTSNTPINLYVCGSGGNEYDSPFSTLVKPGFDYNCNSIIIVPRLSCDSSLDGTLTITDSVISQYNLNPNNVSVSGFSAGSTTAGRIAAYSASGNYNTKISAYVSIDGENINNNELLSQLKANDTKMVIVTRANGFGTDSSRAAARNYAIMGGEAYELYSRDALGLSHQDLNHSTYNNHLYDLLGSAADMINSSNYEIYTYDENGNRSEKPISYEKFVELVSSNIGLNALRISSDGKIEVATLESDNTVLHDYVDSIHREIENTASSTYALKSYDSTTSTPNNTSELINGLFKVNLGLLNSIVTDTNYLLQIGNGIDELDEKMKERLNSFIQVEEQETGTTGGLKGFFSSIGDFIDHNKEILIVGTVGGAVLGYAFVAAKAGAALGTAIAPGVGTAVGAVIGLGVGCVIGAVSSWISSIRQSNSSTPDTTSTPDSISPGGTDSGESTAQI